MSTPRFSLILLASALVLAATGCKRDRARETATTTTTSADVKKMTESAVDAIASARCQREVACEHVGQARFHPSVETCYDLSVSEWQKELNAAACAGGIDKTRLVDCLAAIENASCLDPVGAIERVEECRASKLCVTHGR